MKSRHRAREVALQIIYRFDLATHGGPADGIPASPQQLLEELNQHFNHFQVPMELREFAAQLVAGTLNHVKRLDELLEEHASNWKVARMAFVDRSVLRMALYELIHFKDVPASVVIDEAIELSKQFGTAETPAFVNGILDAIRKALQAGSLDEKL